MQRLFLVAALVVAGCDKWEIATETTVDRAGRAVRRTEIRYTGDGAGEGDRVGTRFRLPEGMIETREERRVVLAQAARTPAEVRPDFVARPEKDTGRPEPRNRVQWARRECVLFEHWTYREEYTDGIDEAERDLAAERLFALVREIVVEAAALEAGDRYDLRRVEGWLDGPGRRLAHDLARMIATEKDGKRLERRALGRLGAEGVAAGETAKDAALERALGAFFGEKLRELLVPKGGQPAYDPGPLFLPDAAGATLLERRFEAAVAAVHGSKEKAQERLVQALGDVLGDLHGAPFEFAARVTLPGRILRTNGYVVESARDARVLWRFTARDAAGTGHALEVETLLERADMLPRPLGTEEALEVVGMLAGLDDAERDRLAVWFRLVRDRKATLEQAEEALEGGLGAKLDVLLEIAARRP